METYNGYVVDRPQFYRTRDRRPVTLFRLALIEGGHRRCVDVWVWGENESWEAKRALRPGAAIEVDGRRRFRKWKNKAEEEGQSELINARAVRVVSQPRR